MSSESILSKNIEYLKQNASNQVIINSILKASIDENFRLNKNTLEYNNTPLASHYNPQKEAQRIVESQCKNKNKIEYPIFVGLSNFYPILHLLDTYSLQKIFIVNYNAYALNLLLSTREYNFLSKTIIIDDPTNIESILSPIIEDHEIAKAVVVENPVHKRVFPNFHKEVLLCLASFFKKKSLSAISFLYFAPIWSRNIILSSLLKTHSSKCLQGVLKNKTALIVGGGPSLDENIEKIKALRDKVFLISLGNPLSTLKKHNIKPDLIVSTDGGFYSSLHLHPFYEESLPIVFPHTAYPSPLFHFKKRLSFSHGSLMENILYPQSPVIPMEGSVLLTAYRIAKVMEASKIIFAAADFGFYNNTHSKYSNSFVYDTLRITKVAPLTSLVFKRASASQKIKNYNDEYMLTNASLNQYRKAFEDIVSKDKSAFVLSKLSAKTTIPLLDMQVESNCNERLEISLNCEVENKLEDLIYRLENTYKKCRIEEEKTLLLEDKLLREVFPVEIKMLEEKGESAKIENRMRELISLCKTVLTNKKAL